MTGVEANSPVRRRIAASDEMSCANAQPNDEELADEVISFDDQVDARYMQIEEGVQSLLARQTPVAADLRLVLAVLRVNLHLERMADRGQAVGIDLAFIAVLSGPRLQHRVEHFGEIVRR